MKRACVTPAMLLGTCALSACVQARDLRLFLCELILCEHWKPLAVSISCLLTVALAAAVLLCVSTRLQCTCMRSFSIKAGELVRLWTAEEQQAAAEPDTGAEAGSSKQRRVSATPQSNKGGGGSGCALLVYVP